MWSFFLQCGIDVEIWRARGEDNHFNRTLNFSLAATPLLLGYNYRVAKLRGKLEIFNFLSVSAGNGDNYGIAIWTRTCERQSKLAFQK